MHRADERSRRLDDAGAEVIVGDLHDLTSVRAAFEGVDRPVGYQSITIKPFVAGSAQDHLARHLSNVAVDYRISSGANDISKPSGKDNR